jgi:AAA domain-containing protein
VDALTPDDDTAIEWGWADEPQDRTPPAQPPEPIFPESWRLLDDVELMDEPDPQFIVADVLPEKSVGVIYATPGGGKTTLQAGLMTSIATGADWFGHRVERPGASICVVAEDASGFKMRVRGAKRAAHLPLDQPIGVYAFKAETIDLRDMMSVHRFITFTQRQRVTWPWPLRTVAIDTYGASTPGSNENSSEDTTICMTHAQLMRDKLDATIILIHHTNAGGSRERGHSAMRGAADFMISLTPVDDVIHVECSKQRNAAPFDKLTLRLVPAPDGLGCVLRPASDVMGSKTLTPAQLKALTILRESFASTGASKSEWQRSAQDVPERTFHRACEKLIEGSYVRQDGSKFWPTSKGLAS